MIPLWLFILVVLVLTGWYFRAAWKYAAEEDRLEELRGKTSPFFWEDQ